MISQLDQGMSTALANIREWRNTFVPINRLPLDVLSLISTHLGGDGDIVSISSTCRHWRNTFTQHAALWSELNLSLKRTSIFVRTRLERAKGSPLDITTAGFSRDNILALLSARSQQFRSLDFIHDRWSSVRQFSEISSGPLPLLHDLKINIVDDDSEDRTPPSSPLFTGAVNLKAFSLVVEGQPCFDRFAFPTLTTFNLTVTPTEGESFHTSQMLDFLGATPTLQTVRIVIRGQKTPAGVDQGRIVVLPNVESFSVTEREPGYEIAAHISCPSANRTTLVLEQDVYDPVPPGIFPTSATWGDIPPQHTLTQMNKAQLDLVTSRNLLCYLTLLSPDSAVLDLGYGIVASEDDDDFDIIEQISADQQAEVFCQACNSIQGHPLFPNVSSLYIQDRGAFYNQVQRARIAVGIGLLLRRAGTLDDLTLDLSDLQLFVAPFIDHPFFQDLNNWYTYPQIKTLTIIERGIFKHLEEECKVAIVELAKRQHGLGVPFECVEFQMVILPEDMVERLQPWVGATYCYQETIEDDDEDKILV